MYIHKYNQYTQKHYRYALEDVDLTSPMFDERIHDNNIEVIAPTSCNVCMYCDCVFESRNKLFYHLGYMNIDIGRDKDYYKQQKRHKRRFSLVKRFRYFVPLKQKNREDANFLSGVMSKKLKLSD